MMWRRRLILSNLWVRPELKNSQNAWGRAAIQESQDLLWLTWTSWNSTRTNAKYFGMDAWDGLTPWTVEGWGLIDSSTPVPTGRLFRRWIQAFYRSTRQVNEKKIDISWNKSFQLQIEKTFPLWADSNRTRLPRVVVWFPSWNIF